MTALPDTREAEQIAVEVTTERGPDRVMHVQRVRMWEGGPEWTRYERILAEALLAERARVSQLTEALEAAEKALANINPHGECFAPYADCSCTAPPLVRSALAAGSGEAI